MKHKKLLSIFCVIIILCSAFTVTASASGVSGAIEAQNGKASVRDTAINLIKGFMAVSLFTIVPVELFKFCAGLQGQLGLERGSRADPSGRRRIVAAMYRNREALLHCAVYIETTAVTPERLRDLQAKVLAELSRSRLEADRPYLCQNLYEVWGINDNTDLSELSGEDYPILRDLCQLIESG